MSYSVNIKRSAEKELERLDDKLHDRVIERIISLEDTPRPYDCKKLKGDERYRIRIGDYRVLYSISDKSKLIEVISVTNRKDAYR